MRHVSALLVLLFLLGCAGPGVGIAPRYDGVVTPVTVPVDLQYSPSFGRAVMSANVVYGRDSGYISMTISYRSVFVGEKLEWFMTIDKMMVGTQSLQHKLPIAQATFIATRKGDIVSIDLAFPALSAVGKPIRKGTKEYEDMVTSMTRSIATFVGTPVVSGDVAMHATSGDIKLPNTPGGKLKMTLDGISTFQGRSVYVLSVDEKGATMVVNDNGRESSLVADIAGYTLLDAATLMGIKGELGLVGQDSSGKRIAISMESHEN